VGDILLTPHPEFSDMMGKLESRTRGAADAFVNKAACREFVERAREAFGRRVASEMTAQP